MKIQLAIIYNIFRPCVKNFGKTAVNHKLKRRDMWLFQRTRLSTI